MKCKFCCQEFKPFNSKSVVTSSNILQREQEIYHKEDRTCSKCFKKCWDKESRLRHEKRTRSSYNCKECDESFSSYMKMKYHSKIVHAAEGLKNMLKTKVTSCLIDTEPHTCDKCGSKFKQRSHLYRHVKEVHCMLDLNLDYVKQDSIEFKCAQCNKSFWRKSDLRRHVDTVHIFTCMYETCVA